MRSTKADTSIALDRIKTSDRKHEGDAETGMFQMSLEGGIDRFGERQERGL